MTTLVSIRSRKESRRGLFIKTFGCQMNEYDSSKIEKLLESSHYKVDAPEQADLVIVNTCSVREKAENKLYSLLGELAEIKQERPTLMIGVGGCVAQQEGHNIVKRSKAVDFVFGTHNLSLVPSLIQTRSALGSAQVAVDYREDWEELPLGFATPGRVSVFVSISRGCNKNCTYCIVPTTRGREVSRLSSEIEREIRIAVSYGAREVVLLGQTVNSYGLDLIPRGSFVELVKKISEIEGLKRIRFTSPHPQEVRDSFIQAMAENPKICRHIHMPLQSGSDRILKLMNRNYRRKRYLEIIAALKRSVPDIAITTDIIVGFPGETEAEFEETLAVMDEVQFDNSFSFAFSPRPGTAAAEMAEQLTQEEKLRRLYVLQARQNEIMTKRLNASVGQEVEILLEGPTALNSDLFQGRNSQNIMVNLNENEVALEAGQLITALVTGVGRYTLKADFIGVVS